MNTDAAWVIQLLTITPLSAALWLGVRHWWRLLDDREAARATPIPRRSELAEFWADIDAWRMRARQEARR